MSFSDRYASLFSRLLPAPFTIAVLLTALTFILAFFFTGGIEQGPTYAFDLIGFWEEGLWNRGLMVFAFQMMLMLILGHVLALTKPVEIIIDATLQYCTNTAKSAFVVTLFTVVVSLFNWGLGLIFGAIFARKVAEYAHRHGIQINYPIIGAAGYSGLMVWHGGISGSSLVKVAEENHLKEMMNGIYNEQSIAGLPTSISFDQTVFGNMNMMVMIVLIVVLPISMYYLGKMSQPKQFNIRIKQWDNISVDTEIKGAEKLNHSRIVTVIFSIFLLSALVIRILDSDNLWNFSFMTPDFINLSLLFLGIFLHGSFQKFISAVDEAIVGAAGILIQFPLYFGIMGLMKNSGMVDVFSEFFVSISNAFTFPLFTFVSAAIVNVFVPSGGGQWAVQGPIIIQTAEMMHIPISKCIMAMAYGDQLTNMLQPFWALPLLGITGLKAKEILPYTLYLMAIGTVIFLCGLIFY